MGNEQLKSEIVVRNEAGDLEIIDLHTGEVVSNNTNPMQPASAYSFNYKTALAIVQQVKEGKTLSQISEDPQFPPLYVISHWQRTDRMFAEEMKMARTERGEAYHDKAMEIAENASKLMYGKEEVPSAKLASDLFKWGAEKANPSRYGNKVTHEGSTEKPILMRVINTGISRHKPDIVVAETKEVTDGSGNTSGSNSTADEAGTKKARRTTEKTIIDV